jgi:hypothetical protein
VNLLARALVVIAALLPPAGATTITILSADNISQATAERNAWLTQTFGASAGPKPIDVDLENQAPHGKSDVQTLSLLTSFHSLYFFMTGVESNLQIRTGDGTKAKVHGDDEGFYFVGITSSAAIGSIEWSGREEFNLRSFGVPRTPGPAAEPATWLCIAIGLVAITLRCRVPCAPS